MDQDSNDASAIFVCGETTYDLSDVVDYFDDWGEFLEVVGTSEVIKVTVDVIRDLHRIEDKEATDEKVKMWLGHNDYGTHAELPVELSKVICEAVKKNEAERLSEIVDSQWLSEIENLITSEGFGSDNSDYRLHEYLKGNEIDPSSKSGQSIYEPGCALGNEGLTIRAYDFGNKGVGVVAYIPDSFNDDAFRQRTVTREFWDELKGSMADKDVHSGDAERVWMPLKAVWPEEYDW